MDVRKGKLSHRPFQHVVQVIKITVLGAFILSCVYIFSHLHFSRYFPIKTVRIYGANRIDHAEMQAILQPLVKRGFFTVNVDYIHDRLMQMPWVSDTFVRRNWPDRVEVTIIEKNVIARWNEESLLSSSGELFSPKKNTYPQALPQFIGPSGKQIEMLQYFNEMNRLFVPLRAKISYLELTPYLTWNLTLDNGITVRIGHKDILTRLDHFVKVYPKIVGNRAADVDYIDLRYPNGMAVRWKETIKV